MVSGFGLDDILEQEEKAAEEASRLPHAKFRQTLHAQLRNYPANMAYQISRIGDKKDEKRKDFPIDTFAYMTDGHKPLRICGEPYYFLAQYDDISTDVDDCVKRFKEEIKKFPIVNLPDKYDLGLDNVEKGMWFNSTSKFINLRPGNENDDEGNPGVLQMGDQAVHGVVVGRTGAGKSVFLNNLIFNLLDEYPPWELDLYLADFKKVELSRYLNKKDAKTPHVKAVAATSEIRYVVTLLERLVEYMKARQTFFMRIGEQKLSDVREKYRIVLPRVLFLVDEFQQLFLEATRSEERRIKELIMSIVKLGRATGFHLLFASQEMGGALSASDLVNFKIRIALPCDASVSAMILGNDAATEISTGFVYVNTGTGARKENRLFRVPYISTDDDPKSATHPFYGPLERFCDLQKRVKDFTPKTSKLYDEDYREKINALKKALNLTKNYRADILQESARYFDIIVLGNGVVYSTDRNDIESFYIGRGRKKNISVMSPRVLDLAYVQKLLTVNFAKSPMQYTHHIFSLDAQMRNMYDFKDDFQKDYIEHFNPEDIIQIDTLYKTRQQLTQAANQVKSASHFIRNCLGIYAALEKSKPESKNQIASIDKMYDDFIKQFDEEDGRLAGYDDEMLADWLEDKDNLDMGVFPDSYLPAWLKVYINIKNKKPELAFAREVYWLCGIDTVNDPPKYLEEILKNGMEYNMFFILFTSTPDDSKFYNLKALPNCDYLFVGGNVEMFYKACKVPYTNKPEDSIVIDFKEKSMNSVRSFKMYRDTGFGDASAPKIDFDNFIQ